MTPFPETEIMTLKRLEVALRKNDFKLLKEGSYKLHEKFHQGHKFEYINLLKDILYNIENSSTPSDIKSILVPTINDILASNGTVANIQNNTKDNSDETVDTGNSENKISNLTSLSYQSVEEDEPKDFNITTNFIQNEHKQEKPDVFSAFSPDYPKTGIVQENLNIQPPEEFKEFTPPENEIEPDESIAFKEFEPLKISENIEEDTKEETTETEKQKIGTPLIKETVPTIEENIRTKTVSIFWGQINSNDKNKNIARYNELISKVETENISLNEVLDLISVLNVQSNSNIAELASILEQIKNKNIKINLITNSSSASIVGFLENIKLPYKLNSNEEKLNLVPLFGLSNFYKCHQCNEEFLDIADEINPLIIQCPKCKKAMFPIFSSIKEKINLDYYNSMISALANSDIWLFLSPSANEEELFGAFKGALGFNKNIEQIFICDKDINSRESYRNMFCKINPTVKINTEITALEDFYKSI